MQQPNYKLRVYYKLNDDHYVTYDMNNKEIIKGSHYSIPADELGDKKFKPRYFKLLPPFTETEEDLIAFSEQLLVWVQQIKDTISYNYFSSTSHSSAIYKFYTHSCIKGKQMNYKSEQKIDITESSWIESCCNAPLRYCQPGTYDTCYGVDFKAFYGTILGTMDVPISQKCGVEKNLSDDKEFEKVAPMAGFYRVLITSNDSGFLKVFKFSKKHTYTHYSIMQARACKKRGMDVDIQLIHDDKPNAYQYASNDIVKSNQIFKRWYEELLKVKDAHPKNGLIKSLLSSTWGNLSQKFTFYFTDDEINQLNLQVGTIDQIHTQFYITDMRLVHGTCVNTLVDRHQLYKYSLARMKPFLLSKGRMICGNIALIKIDKVIRIQTDGLVFSKYFKEVNDTRKDFKSYPKLVAEAKTSGKIKWIHENAYINFTTKTKHGRIKQEDDEEL